MNDIRINNLGFIFEESYENADSFLKDITYGGELYDYFFTGDFVYRGHKSNSYKLIPSVLRDNCTEIRHASSRSPNVSTTDREQLAYEFDILRKFYLKCDELGLYLPDNKRLRSGQFSFDDNGTITKDGIWLPEDLYDITALAQHYGLPTRLLDWSYEISIAIFFAISELIKEDNCDENDFICIWVLNKSKTTWLTFNWALQDFPLHLIRPIYKYNPNMKAQKGLFTLWKLHYSAKSNSLKDCRPLDELIKEYFDSKEERFKNAVKPLLGCFMIRQTKSNIKKLYRFIKNNNVDFSTLFPGYSGVVEYLKYDKIYEDKDLYKSNI